MMTCSIRQVLWLVALGAMAACGEEPPPPAPVVAKKKVEPVAAPVATAHVDYVYNPINKRDPFRGLFIDAEKLRPRDEAEKAACDEPLCLVDIDDLKMVAVISGDASPLAMVEDRRTGVGHLVRRHTRIGKQGGTVTQILRDCVVVTSFISGADGKSQANKQNMCVASDVKTAPPIDLLKGKEFTQ